jgi:flagellar biosynthesis/type III secretory pathway M-ring protein FliF/YscJ
MPQEFWANAVYSLIPTIVIGLLFWLILRSVLRSDRTERAVSARIENEERVKAGLPPI